MLFETLNARPSRNNVKYFFRDYNGARTGRLRPLGSQGHPKPTATLACPEGAPLEMG